MAQFGSLKLSHTKTVEDERLLRGAFLSERSELLQVTRDFLRFAGRGEDGFLVILQNSEP